MARRATRNAQIFPTLNRTDSYPNKEWLRHSIILSTEPMNSLRIGHDPVNINN